MDIIEIVKQLESYHKHYSAWYDGVSEYVEKKSSMLGSEDYCFDMFKKEVNEYLEKQRLSSSFECIIELIDKLCVLYIDNSDAQREYVRKQIQSNNVVMSYLFTYAYFVAEKLQVGEFINAKKGFVALIIENGNFDYRDTLTALSDIYISAEEKGINVKKLIAEVYPIASKDEFGEEGTFYETLKEFEFHPVINERRKDLCGDFRRSYLKYQISFP
ncbi:MAG TPA: hypothetical protein VIO64_02650 [Pseudobacteroides sp.]|uniref:hypothetical protein n=1 Tax=Pseudobacteroides sp. TaxID=1968840 RepID=UPI002F95866A